MDRPFNLVMPHSTVVESYLRMRWIPWLFVVPLIAYPVLRYFETELTSFIVPFFPVESDKSFGFYRDLLRLCFDEMLWWSFFLLTAWILLVYISVDKVLMRVEERLLSRTYATVAIIAFSAFLTSIIIAYSTLHSFANSADEYVYLHQAETLSNGKLSQDAHPLKEFFFFNHLAQKDGVMVGRFPPGWPLLLSIPFALNIPPTWLNPLLGAVTLVVFFSFVRRYYGERVAIWSTLSLSFTGFFIFNAASFFSHTSCALFTVGFVYCFHLYREKRSITPAVVAGVCLGMIVIIRYFTAVLVFLPVMVALVHDFRMKAFKPLILMGLGAVPFVVYLLWYNYQITDNPLLPVTVWVDPTEGLGFVKGHTFMKGAEHLVRRALLFMYWSSPALLMLYLIYLAQKLGRARQLLAHPEDYFFILLVAGYFFYHHPGGNQYGPRFFFEAFPFLVVFVVDRVLRARVKWPLALLVAGMIYAVVKLPYIVERENRVVEERLDVFARVEEQNISNAVVLLSSHTGVIRPMPPGDLTRNGMDYERDVIYAHDLGDLNRELMAFYPNRAFFRYVRDPETVGGTLERMQRAH